MGLRNRIAKSYAVRPGYWFAPKRFGWGVVPVTWQGLVATAAFVAAIIACATLSPGP
ncbi:hypothetical protein [Stakelama saccharophila]|uniref:Uncharacterized protein n=1 Tax=Stakelama saccharophila TaxID=3075605 RepID=A0ABZ0BBG4_9SPHN|nr:hypothetical protein [Stakelama sp. W311]WNO54618.1 hypothetical protein RPR59_05035 [Stakelama sp. W311]